jgi:hypothetical protein
MPFFETWFSNGQCKFIFNFAFIKCFSGPPSYVYWYRDDVVVNYSGRKGIHIWTGDAVPKDIDKLDDDEDSVNVTTSTSTITSTSVSDYSHKAVVSTSGTSEVSRQSVNQRLKSRRRNRNRTLVVSMLEIQMVMPDDAGTYTCAPSNARNHSAVVHVIQGMMAKTTL